MESNFQVPRLTAAALTLGLGIAACAFCGQASADSGSPASSSGQPGATGHSAPAGTSGAGARKRPTAKIVDSAAPPRAARSARPAPAAVDQPTPSAHAAPQSIPALISQALKPLAVAADTVAAVTLGSLGYLPSTADSVPTFPLPPLRTVIEDAVAAVRREMNNGLPNQTPTARPVQLHEFVTGEVVGDLLPSDVNGDTLSYQVVQGPANGRIVVNPNGTYAYTPTSQFARTGGIDTFVVAIDDGHQGQTVVPVDVTVSPALGLSRNFYFRNYTLAPLKFTGYHGTTGDLDSGPAIGTVIMPGQEYKWEVTYYFFDSGSVTPQFATVGFGATPSDAGYIPPGVGGTYQASFIATGYEGKKSIQCAAGGGGVCNTSGDNLAIALDKAGTVVTLSSTDANKVANVLPAICYDGSDASCSYKAKSEVSGFTTLHPVGASVANETEKSTTFSISISDQVSQTDNVSISAKFSGGQLAKLASIINVEITATYGHSWTNSHTFTQTLNVPVDPGYVSQVNASEPVWKVTGDFTITLGNSTYKLTDATFDTPNPNGTPAFVISTKPIKKVPAV